MSPSRQSATHAAAATSPPITEKPTFVIITKVSTLLINAAPAPTPKTDRIDTHGTLSFVVANRAKPPPFFAESKQIP